MIPSSRIRCLPRGLRRDALRHPHHSPRGQTQFGQCKRWYGWIRDATLLYLPVEVPDCAAGYVGRHEVQAEFIDELEYVGLARSDPLCAKVEHERRPRCRSFGLGRREHAPTDAVPRFEHGHRRTGGAEINRCAKSGQPSANDGEVRLAAQLSPHRSDPKVAGRVLHPFR